MGNYVRMTSKANKAQQAVLSQHPLRLCSGLSPMYGEEDVEDQDDPDKGVREDEEV